MMSNEIEETTEGEFYVNYRGQIYGPYKTKKAAQIKLDELKEPTIEPPSFGC